MTWIRTQRDIDTAARVGANIRLRRLKLGISQLELANHLHTTRRAVWAWENGETEMHYATMLALSKVLSLKINDMFNLEVDPNAGRGIRRSDMVARKDTIRGGPKDRRADRSVADHKERSHGSKSELRVVDSSRSADSGSEGTRGTVGESLRAS